MKKKEPVISILIPVYNAAEYLRECIDSVLAQTYKNLEVILVDDGSTDGSDAICHEYMHADKRVRVIHQKNQGAAEARNVALSIMSGDYVIFVDSDDWIDEKTCEEALDLAVQEEADLVIWSYYSEYPNKRIPRIVIDGEQSVFSGDSCANITRRFVGPHGEEVYRPETLDVLSTLWGKLFRAECLRKADARLVDLSIIGTAEDALFNLQISSEIKKIAVLNRVYYHYRKYNMRSITSRYKKDLWKKWNNLYDYMEHIIEGKYSGNVTYKEALKNRIAINIIGAGLNIYSGNCSYREKIHELRQILRSDRYRKAIASLNISKMKIYWKVFFWLARLESAQGILLLCGCIRILKSRR